MHSKIAASTVVPLAVERGREGRPYRELVLEVDQVVVEPGPECLRLVPLRLGKLCWLHTLRRLAPLPLRFISESQPHFLQACCPGNRGLSHWTYFS